MSDDGKEIVHSLRCRAPHTEDADLYPYCPQYYGGCGGVGCVATKKRKKPMDELDIRHRCFMDGIDWQHHLSGDATGTELFPSEDALREKKTCLSGGCGVVEVEVRLIRWVEPQNLEPSEG